MRLTADLRMYRHSGIGRYLRNLFPLLLPSLKADRIRVLGSSELFGEENWFHDPRVELFETHAAIYSIAEQLLSTRGAYRDSDLLWVPHYNAPLYYPGKLIVTIHDIAPLMVPQILDNSIKRFYARTLIRRTVSQAAAIFCVSDFTRQEVEVQLNIDASRLIVTKPGLDLDWPNVMTPHCEDDDVPYLLFVGNIKPNKNLGLLLQAFDKVRGQIPHRLLIVGRMHGFSTADKAVKGRAAEAGDRVRMAGEVSDKELQRLYAGASALVVPSVYEGFGLTLLEAMQLGCPVISSSAGSLPEVGGDAAMYFDPSSMNELAACLLRLQMEGIAEGLREKGRQRVLEFSFEDCAMKTAVALNSHMQTVS